MSKVCFYSNKLRQIKLEQFFSVVFYRVKCADQVIVTGSTGLSEPVSCLGSIYVLFDCFTDCLC